MNAGAIHVGGVGNTPPIFAAAAEEQDQGRPGGDVRRHRRRDRGAARLAASRRSAELKGKKVAVAKGSSANYHLLAQLKEAGLDATTTSRSQNLQPADALAAFTAGHVDAWAIWEPFTSQAEADAGAQVIADGDGLVNGYTFQVASDDALDDPATTAALATTSAGSPGPRSGRATHKEEWSEAGPSETGLPPTVTLAARQQAHDRASSPIDDDGHRLRAGDGRRLRRRRPAARRRSTSPTYFTDEFNDVVTGGLTALHAHD